MGKLSKNQDYESLVKVHFTQVYGIKAAEQELDFFGTNLEYDTPLFIDPFLIKRSKVQEERELFERFGVFFKKAYQLSLTAGGTSEEYRKLKKYFKFKEPKELYLGYTEGSNQGLGLGDIFAEAMTKLYLDHSVIKLLIEEGNYPDNKINPAVFELVGEKLGPDGISDLSASLLMDYLIKYTQDQCKQYGVPLVNLPVREQFDFSDFEWTGGIYADLPKNPLTGEAVVLVPKRLLRAQNIANPASAKSKIVGLLREDDFLRDKFIGLVSKILGEITMEEVYDAIRTESSLVKRYLELVEKEDPGEYDFEMDFLKFLATKKFADYFNDVQNKKINNGSELVNLLFEFLEEVSRFMVFKGGWKKMWKSKWSKKTGHCKEIVVGRMIYALGYSFFVHYPEVTFDTEVDTGRGYIDFRLIMNEFKIVIELKNLCNDAPTGKDTKKPAYLHGITRQLPIYAVAEKATHALYLTAQHYKFTESQSRNDTPRLKEIEDVILQTEADIKNKNKKFQKLFHYNLDISRQPAPSKA